MRRGQRGRSSSWILLGVMIFSSISPGKTMTKMGTLDKYRTDCFYKNITLKNECDCHNACLSDYHHCSGVSVKTISDLESECLLSMFVENMPDELISDDYTHYFRLNVTHTLDHFYMPSEEDWRYYLVIDVKGKTFDEARSECIRTGGDLAVSLDDPELLIDIWEQFAPSSSDYGFIGMVRSDADRDILMWLDETNQIVEDDFRMLESEDETVKGIVVTGAGNGFFADECSPRTTSYALCQRDVYDVVDVPGGIFEDGVDYK